MKSLINRVLVIFFTPFIPFILLSCGGRGGDYDASGIFEATEVVVSAEATGKILRLNLLEGDRVEAEQELGYIDTLQLSLKRQQLVANIGSVASRRMTVSKQLAAIEEQILKQQQERERFSNLVRVNAANQKQLDDIDSQLKVLERQLVAQRETLERVNSGVSSETLAIALQVEQLEDQITKSVIHSPISGTILSKYAEQGEFTPQGRALFKVADIDNMFLRAYITSTQLTEVKIGDSIALYADIGESGRKEYRGHITWISDKAEFTPKTIQTRDQRANLVYAVKIAVQNDGYLKRGMYAEIRFAGGTEE